MEVVVDLKYKKSIAVFSIVIVSVLVISVIYSYFHSLHTINKENSYIIIKNESSLSEVAKQFKSRGIIKPNNSFLVYARLFGMGSGIKESKLIIKPNMNYKELILKLQNGQSDFAVVTIPEGFTLYQISERLQKNLSLNKDNFLNITISDLTYNDLISKRDNTHFDLEGFLYPDTYYIPVGYTEKDAANLMFNRFKSVFSDKYIIRTKELGLSINQVITIASLIEKEAANDNERSRIAGVIYNRIKKGMPLQIDAAVIYAITKGKGTIQKVTYDDLKIQDVYNTYLYKGFPPGPIASPGKPSIEAALYPEENDYLYYVANGKGHVFSKTYEEHMSNVKKYIK